MKRFVFTADMLQKYHHYSQKPMVKFAFDILSSVKQTGSFPTQWSIVYDLGNLTVYFRTRRHPQIKSLDLSTFDRRCSDPVKVLDMQTDTDGDVHPLFKDYSEETNYNLIDDAFSGSGYFGHVPNHVIRFRATYPDNNRCIE